MLNNLQIPLEFSVPHGSYHIHFWGKKEKNEIEETNDIVYRQSKKLLEQYALQHEISLKLLNQVHGNSVIEVDDIVQELPDADSLFSKSKNVALGIKTADCVPVLFFHRKILLHGGIHTGWKGLELKTFTKTLESLNCDISELFFVIGPHIFIDNYETSEDVFMKFPLQYSQKSSNDKKRYLSMIKILKNEMKTNKVEDHQIMNINENTYQSERFYSHRSGNSGRNFNVIFFKGRKEASNF